MRVGGGEWRLPGKHVVVRKWWINDDPQEPAIYQLPDTEWKVTVPRQQICSVTPLTPLTGADAIAFENGQNVQLGGLTAEMQEAVACLQTVVIAAGGMFNIGSQAPPVDPTNAINSAYRPAEYQLHLRESVG